MGLYEDKQKKIHAVNEGWKYSIINEIEYEGPFYLYEPFEVENGDIPYWNEKIKVVFCNLNAYGEGDEKEGFNRLTWNNPAPDVYRFYDWMWEGEKNGHWQKPSNTNINTAIFVYTLLEKLDGKSLSENRPRYDFEQMKQYMQRICYMNMYPCIHWNEKDEPEKNWEKISGKAWDFYDKHWETRSLMREMVETLKPDIFIVTGKDGVKMLNRIYQFKGDETVPDEKKQYHYTGEELGLDWMGLKRFKGTELPLFVSIRHPCVPMSWNEIIGTIEKIKKNMPSKTTNV
jgi:hypothetical protein